MLKNLIKRLPRLCGLELVRRIDFGLARIEPLFQLRCPVSYRGPLRGQNPAPDSFPQNDGGCPPVRAGQSVTINSDVKSTLPTFIGFLNQSSNRPHSAIVSQFRDQRDGS